MLLKRCAVEAAIAVTCDDNSRYYLNAIKISPDGAIDATDGMIALQLRGRDPLPDAEYPAKGLPAFVASPTAAFLLPTPAAETLIKATPKKPRIPVLGCLQVGEDADGVYVAATDLESVTVKRIDANDPQAAQYPNFDRVLPAKDRPAIKVILSATLLKDLIAARIASANGDKTIAGIAFYIPTEDQYQGRKAPTPEAPDGAPDGELTSAIRVEWETHHVTVTGAIMPCRL
jgi:hypothetical protein